MFECLEPLFLQELVMLQNPWLLWLSRQMWLQVSSLLIIVGMALWVILLLVRLVLQLPTRNIDKGRVKAEKPREQNEPDKAVSSPVAPPLLSSPSPEPKTDLNERVRSLEELGLLQSLYTLISEAPDFSTALGVALSLVCEVTNWDYGEVWLPRPDYTVLDCSSAWYSRSPTLEWFRQESEKLVFEPNRGLPGRVWASRRPEWIAEISAQTDASVVRPQAYQAGLKAGFGVPILIGDHILAIMTFFLTQSRAEDQQLVGLVSAVATQLGLVIQRKQLEAELRQQKDFSQTLIETSSAFFVAVDAKGRTIMMNQGFLEAVGYTLQEVLGTNYLLTFVRKSDRPILYKTFKQLVKNRQSILQENYVLTKDGRELLVEWRGKPILKTSQTDPGKEGQLDFFFGVGIDITQRKQLEQELQKSEQRYRAIVEDQSELICRFLADGTLTFVNDAYCRYFGKTHTQLLGSSIFQFIPQEYQEKTQRQLAKLSPKNPVATRDYQVLMPDGDIHWQQWTDRAIFDPSSNQGQIVEFQSVGRDITERRKSEQETARLASIALLSPNPIIETDLVGNVRYLNPEAMRLLPDLLELGAQHPFLAGVISMAEILRRKGSIQREVTIGTVVYEQVLHYLEEIDCFRIYAFDISDRKKAEKQLIHNAFYDQLTGLPNRALFMDRLKQAVQRAKQSRNSKLRREPDRFAVLFVNLNRFKLVNDSLGNDVGDQLLQNFAQRLQSCLRPTDTVARLGADEFTILLEGIQDVNDATHVAECIQQTLTSPFYLKDREVFMTINIGIAISTSHDEQPEELLRNADLAMYRARSQGKSFYEVFDAAMHELAVERLQLETDLRRAIERQEFRVYYQPIVSLATGRIIGFEALVRWQHPERGLVFPNDFIPIAEETGLISPMGWWTLGEACRQLSEWQKQFPAQPPLTMNVNLSCKQFTQPDLLSLIDGILKETKLAIGSLKLEITESIVMDNPDWVKDVLLELKKRKIHLCIDDFGTGYSSLSRLHHFPISTLKIDRSFISRIGALGENSEIVQAIVMLAQTLSIDVVAEGIELSEQVSPLLALKCEYGQGYFFSKPVDSKAATALLMAERESLGAGELGCGSAGEKDF